MEISEEINAEVVETFEEIIEGVNGKKLITPEIFIVKIFIKDL
jgi:hypothetical protein